MQRIRDKLKKVDSEPEQKKFKPDDDIDEPFEEYDFHKERKEERKKKAYVNYKILLCISQICWHILSIHMLRKLINCVLYCRFTNAIDFFSE